jgi:CRISPR-associated protein Cas5d
MGLVGVVLCCLIKKEIRVKTFCLDVQAPLACFTRPEMKVERVSYDVMTPSAVRAVFEAILWKPAICWIPLKMVVLNPIRWMNLRRNEVASKISMSQVTSAMTHGKGRLAMYVEEDRQQRAGLLLRDVHYRIYATFEMTHKRGADETPQKFAEMFERRAKKGQCINQPYLGCREFSCAFEWSEASSECQTHHELNGDHNLGWMLYDMDYQNLADPSPRFFNATMKQGVVEFPLPNSQEIVG